MKKPNLHQFDLSNLANKTQDRADIIKDKTLSQGFKKALPIEKIDNSAQKIVKHSDVLDKVAKFRADRAAKKLAGEAAGVLGGGVAKKLGLAALGPVGMMMGAAEDAMASEDANVGSDEPYLKEEALLNNPYENFADPEVSEQARRYQKIRSMLGRE